MSRGRNQFGFMSSFMCHHSHSIDAITFYFFLSARSFSAQMPAKYRKNKVKPRGVSNRNRGLEWIRANASDGVLYFADDDNTYDLDIFDEVRIDKINFGKILKGLTFIISLRLFKRDNRIIHFRVGL